MYFIDRTAVVLKPTEAFLEWLKAADSDLPDLTLSQLRANCSVFLIPEFDEPEQAVAYFDERHREIFAAELAGWMIDQENGRRPWVWKLSGAFSNWKCTTPCSIWKTPN